METIHQDDHPVTQYLEGTGSLESPSEDVLNPNGNASDSDENDGQATVQSFAPTVSLKVPLHPRRPILSRKATTHERHANVLITRLHLAWSSAWNSRIGAADNARFMEHFRYIIVASQLLNEYLDHGALPPSTVQTPTFDGAREQPGKIYAATTSLYGAAAAAAVAFTLVYIIHWARTGRISFSSKSQGLAILFILTIAIAVGYVYARKQWLKFLRQNAVSAISDLTTNWQALEVSASSTLTFIQEVELVSKGYRISSPMPPASRIEEQGPARRCGRLRKVLHKAYETTIPECIQACSTLRTLVNSDDLDKFFEIYDINSQDAQDAQGADALSGLDDDAESLKSLRVLSYRAGVLRRITLCSLMSLEADGGHSDFPRWRTATTIIDNVNHVIVAAAEKVQKALDEVETIATPLSPVRLGGHSTQPSRERLRTQVRKISMLSSGIKGLQAKMQIMREETNRSVSMSEDLTDLGPSLMAQYESIGSDLKELMQAWETGKEILMNNIVKQERRISLASSGLGSTYSSLGGLTAVDEGSPDDALRTLSGEKLPSNRSSMMSASSSDEVYEAIAVPKQRSNLTREERIAKMQDERDKQATIRARREANTSMLRELESVIHLRPKKLGDGTARVTSV